MQKITCYCLLLGIVLSSCKNALDKKVNLPTLRSDITEIRKDNPNSYTPEDYDIAGDMVAGEAMGAMFSQALGGKDIDTSKLPKVNINFTYRQLLDSAQHKRVAYETAMTEYNTKAKELKDIINVEVVNKGEQSDEYGINSFLVVQFKYATGGSKAIKGFTGDMVAYDLFNKELSHLEIKCTDNLKPNQVYGTTGQFNVNFDDGLTEIVRTDTSKLKFVWKPSTVVFDDGSELKVPEIPKKP